MKNFILTAATTALITANTAASWAAPSELNPVTKVFDSQGLEMSLTVHPEFEVNGAEGELGIELGAMIDGSDVQKKLATALNKSWKNEECGDRIHTSNFKIEPQNNGSAVVSVTAQVQRWECVKFDKPVTYTGMCKIGWLKTKCPKFKTVRETIKTKLISQSIDVVATVTPGITDGDIDVNVNVNKAMPGGLLGKIVKAFGLHGKFKNAIERRVQAAVLENMPSLPEGLEDYNVTFTELRFVDLGGGRLGLDIAASGGITQQQIAEIVNEKLAEKLSTQS